MKRYEKRELEIQRLQALTRMAREPYGIIIIKWLEDSRLEQQDANDFLTKEDLHIGQGKSQTLRTILDEIRGAPAALAAGASAPEEAEP